jgi:DMSO/TMAO reductase YedYZ heme-binding membrane subunit
VVAERLNRLGLLALIFLVASLACTPLQTLTGQAWPIVLLVPPAATSTAKMLKRMCFVGWKRLHRLAYVAGTLGVIHFFLRVKKDATEPLIYAGILGVLFAIRIAAWAVKKQKKGGARPA